ncbi:Uracil phosphoribosyltransferase [Thermobaculum terrenum ATCC BAA-798]|uniref:Bifunctional protein PyrR n=1 Tax=Thermobaculum terrenum (strain ATCC BAA-798 / CCMEE 7001 / YNP1) TaxID=525904 RepID=D1CBW7_THET1|nr:bifunctional pyr operon transcriptional regulator/uracil phosphoribosyltransferase PyrR [Thermobaculum terrenum]ACZ42282.1 Uracil phosphoribosyltransferase [Thermobaculum terrenum ATCC BAA-798]
MGPNRLDERAKNLIDQSAMRRMLIRMAHQIFENNPDLYDVVLIGIRTRGVHLAHRLQTELLRIGGVKVPVGEIDITPYRDDLLRRDDYQSNYSNVDFQVENRTVILVDDVLYTGRTARAAMEAVIDMGRPARIQLAVLIDRGHRELPIRPDYVGKNLPSSREEEVLVRISDVDGVEGVYLVRRGED